jgi:hypothetical protein
MMESLFGYTQQNDKIKGGQKKESSLRDTPQYIQIIDSKKAQNLSILLRALNVTLEEVRDALLEGFFLFHQFSSRNAYSYKKKIIIVSSDSLV